MPLYITERVSEIDVDYNSDAKFVYFDTEKEDSTSTIALLLRGRQNALLIRHRNNMSNSGQWNDEDLDTKYRKIISKDFKNVSVSLRNANLVIFPIRVFNLVQVTLDTKIHDLFFKKFNDLVKLNAI